MLNSIPVEDPDSPIVHSYWEMDDNLILGLFQDPADIRIKP